MYMAGPQSISDEIVRRACEGNQSAVRDVIQALARQVRLMAAARLSSAPDRMDALDEITQRALLSLLAGLPRLEIRTGLGLRGFASTIVSRRVADYLRERRSEQKTHARPTADPISRELEESLSIMLTASDTTPCRAAQRGETLTRIATQLGRLLPQHREVIALAFFDQLPTAEIAKRLDISRPAASMLLMRAVRALRAALPDDAAIVDHPGSP